MNKNHFLKPAPKSLKPSKFHKKSGGNRKFKGYMFFAFCFLLSLFLSLCFSCVCCFLFVFSLFFLGVLFWVVLFVFFLIVICFWISVEKQYVPPPLYKMPQSVAIFYKLARTLSLGHRPSRKKKNLYNLPRCFAKITDFKKCKKKL